MTYNVFSGTLNPTHFTYDCWCGFVVSWGCQTWTDD